MRALACMRMARTTLPIDLHSSLRRKSGRLDTGFSKKAFLARRHNLMPYLYFGDFLGPRLLGPVQSPESTSHICSRMFCPDGNLATHSILASPIVMGFLANAFSRELAQLTVRSEDELSLFDSRLRVPRKGRAVAGRPW